MSAPATTALRLGAIVLDCPDPPALATFYAELLGWTVAEDSDDTWAWIVSPHGRPTMCFQPAADYRPPTWPDPERPQMLHLDVEVSDLDAEHERVVRIGARPLTDRQGSFRVYADPAGHPFCLVTG